MIKQTFTLILLLVAITSVQSASNADHIFKEMCDWRTREINAGTFDEAIKAMNVCREKLLSKDELAAVDKCESIIPLNKIDQVTKTCTDSNGNKDKYAEDNLMTNNQTILIINNRKLYSHRVPCSLKDVTSSVPPT